MPLSRSTPYGKRAVCRCRTTRLVRRRPSRHACNDGTTIGAGRHGFGPRRRADEGDGSEPARSGRDRRRCRRSRRRCQRGPGTCLHALATLVAYLRSAEQAGISPGDALPKINVALAADIDEFATIAKLRAARRLIWRVADASGAGDVAASVHAQLSDVLPDDGEARSVDQYSAHDDRLHRRGTRRRRCDRRSAVHVRTRQTARVRTPRRPQHSDRLPGGKSSRPRQRSGGRLVVRRKPHRGHGEEGLGNFPGHRGAAAACSPD